MIKSKKFKILCTALMLVLTFAGLGSAEDPPLLENPDLSGRWIVHMRNSLGVKSCNFDIQQEDDRLRGKILIYGADPTDLDGRFEGENGVLLWGVYKEPRTGATSQLEYKGTYEGEPGLEVLKGKCEYFGKRYDFTAKRKKKKRS